MVFNLIVALMESQHGKRCLQGKCKLHNGLNTNGSFTVDDSNSFFSHYKILPIAQENKYLGIFSYFIMELYVVCTH